MTKRSGEDHHPEKGVGSPPLIFYACFAFASIFAPRAMQRFSLWKQLNLQLSKPCVIFDFVLSLNFDAPLLLPLQPPYMEGSRHSRSKAEDEENIDDINGGEGEDGAGGGYELGNTRGRGEEGAGGEEGSEESSEEGGAVPNGASTSQHPAKKQRGSSAAANLEKAKSQSAAAAKKAKAQSAKGVAAKKK